MQNISNRLPVRSGRKAPWRAYCWRTLTSISASDKTGSIDLLEDNLLTMAEACFGSVMSFSGELEGETEGEGIGVSGARFPAPRSGIVAPPRAPWREDPKPFDIEIRRRDTALTPTTSGKLETRWAGIEAVFIPPIAFAIPPRSIDFAWRSIDIVFCQFHDGQLITARCWGGLGVGMTCSGGCVGGALGVPQII